MENKAFPLKSHVVWEERQWLQEVWKRDRCRGRPVLPSRQRRDYRLLTGRLKWGGLQQREVLVNYKVPVMIMVGCFFFMFPSAPAWSLIMNEIEGKSCLLEMEAGRTDTSLGNQQQSQEIFQPQRLNSQKQIWSTAIKFWIISTAHMRVNTFKYHSHFGPREFFAGWLIFWMQCSPLVEVCNPGNSTVVIFVIFILLMGHQRSHCAAARRRLLWSSSQPLIVKEMEVVDFDATKVFGCLFRGRVLMILYKGCGLPLWARQRMLCLLWTSQSRTVSSCDPDRRSVPSMDTDRHVTRFLTDTITMTWGQITATVHPELSALTTLKQSACTAKTTLGGGLGQILILSTVWTHMAETSTRLMSNLRNRKSQ